MIILNAIYKKPNDTEAFHTHYKDVHMPLVLKVPGLHKAELEMVTATYMGDADDHYMIARMYYKSKEDFKTAMRSEENKATGADLMRFAKDKVTLFVTEI